MCLKTIAAGLGTFLMFGLSQAEAASFDCSRAKSRIENMICRTDNVSALDEELSRRYKQLAAQADASALKADQLAWMRARDQCKDAACLAESYQARLKFLSVWNDPDPEPGNVSGLYGTRRPSFIYNPDTQKEDPVEMWDCMALKRRSDSELQFRFVLFGANAHSCEMEGVARKKNPSTYEYREPMALGSQAECRLSIRFAKGYVELLDEDMTCRQEHCGLRAGISGAAFARSHVGTRECKALQ